MPVVGWLLNLAYAGLLIAVSPILGYRMIAQGKYGQGWREKLLGWLPRSADDERVVWLHAVSVGEVLQLKPILARLRVACPGWTLFITTTTSTGHAVAREQFSDCPVSYFPADFTWAVSEALDRVRPELVVLVELELWPNFIRETTQRGIPLALINGRVSERSHRGYRRIQPLMRRLLRRFSVLAVQSADYADRLIDLGAVRDRIHVTGSVKFDGLRADRDDPAAVELRRSFGIRTNETVFIAGSTHDPEERLALETYVALSGEVPNLRLVLAPRHKERFEEVAELVVSFGLGVLRRSDVRSQESGARSQETRNPTERSSLLTPGSAPVLLLDTLGELSACWGLADVAFVGGSLTSRGGQNMIEPAAYGAAVVVGPNTQNFRDVVEGLKACGGIQIVGTGAELTRAVRQCVIDPKSAGQMGQRAAAFVATQQGATDRTVRLLTALLSAENGIHAKRAA